MGFILQNIMCKILIVSAQAATVFPEKISQISAENVGKFCIFFFYIILHKISA